MKVLIVGLPRSGTTYVQQLFRYYMKVDRHNLINEPFRSNVGTAYPVTTKKTPEEWLQSVEHVKQNGVIVKDHVHHYEMFEKETGQPFPYEIYDDFYKIKLLRSNFKSGVMSLVVSRKWGKYNDFKGDTILNEKLHIDRELLQTALNYGLVSRLSSMVAVDITPSRPINAKLNTSKLKAAIPSGWDKGQFEFEYKDIVPPRLQKISSRNNWFENSNLIQKSEMLTLPQTALNWKAYILFAILITLFGFAMLVYMGRKSNV